MRGERPTDAAIARALRERIPDRAPSELRARIGMQVRGLPQQRPLPWGIGTLFDPDAVRPRNLLLVALLLLALLLAVAGVGGAFRDLQRRDPFPEIVLAPPADLDAYMADAYRGLLDLPALRLVMSDGDVVYHDGSGVVRHERGTGSNAAVELYSRTRTGYVGRLSNGSRVWVVGPPQDADPRLQIFLTGLCCPVDPECETQWTYVGLEDVLGRPTHHVRCGADRWIDVELRIPLRVRMPSTGPTPPPLSAGPSAAADDVGVAVLEIGPQTQALFAENPEGLAEVTEADYRCLYGGSCPRPSGRTVARPSPPVSAVHGPAPQDLDAFVASVRTTFGGMSALELVVESWSDPTVGDASPMRYRWDGAENWAMEEASSGSLAWLRTGGRTYEQFPPGRWHDYGPGSGVGPPEWPMLLPSACPSGWQHRGFELVFGRSAHRVVCAYQEFWIDEQWLLVTRVQQNPDWLSLRTSWNEIVSLVFVPQPPGRFRLPLGADIFCPRCASPSPTSSATAAPS